MLCFFFIIFRCALPSSLSKLCANCINNSEFFISEVVEVPTPYQSAVIQLDSPVVKHFIISGLFLRDKTFLSKETFLSFLYSEEKMSNEETRQTGTKHLLRYVCTLYTGTLVINKWRNVPFSATLDSLQ